MRPKIYNNFKQAGPPRLLHQSRKATEESPGWGQTTTAGGRLPRPNPMSNPLPPCHDNARMMNSLWFILEKRSLGRRKPVISLCPGIARTRGQCLTNFGTRVLYLIPRRPHTRAPLSLSANTLPHQRLRKRFSSRDGERRSYRSKKKEGRSPGLGRRLPSRVALLPGRVQHLDVFQREAVSDVRHVLLQNGGLVEGERRLQRLSVIFSPIFGGQGWLVDCPFYKETAA